MRLRASYPIFLLLFLTGLAALRSEQIYVIQPGDSIYSLSKKYGVSVQAIRDANRSLDPRKLKVGQHLVLPVPATSRNLPPPPTRVTPVNPVNPVNDPPEPVLKSTKPGPNEPRYLFIDSIKDIIDTPRVVPGRWRYIVLHHSGTDVGNATIFDLAHLRRGMENGLAYHFVIGNGSRSGDGQIEVGRRWLKQLLGGHLKSEALNQISLGICFVGNFNETRPTKKQIAAAIELISYLRQICGPPPILMTHTEIHPHHTDCPGKLFPSAAFHQLFDNP